MREAGQELTRKQKKEYYQLIINLGMHKECLKSNYQIQALENCYGRDAITEKEFGTERGRSQSKIHITKRRAEDNIIKYICKNLVSNIKRLFFVDKHGELNFIRDSPGY